MDENLMEEKKVKKVYITHERARKKTELVHTPWLRKTRNKIRDIKNSDIRRFQNYDEVIWYLIERHERLLKIENRELGVSNLTKKEEYEYSRKSLLNSMTKEEKKKFIIEEVKLDKEEFDRLK